MLAVNNYWYTNTQFPGSDYLPWAGEEMLTALFTRAFSIGSLHPSMTSSKSMTSSVGGNTNPSSMAGRDSPPIPHEPPRADSPPPPKPISGPAPEKQHTFPETGGMFKSKIFSAPELFIQVSCGNLLYESQPYLLMTNYIYI